MRADRLLSILLLLQVHRRMTARELAGRLEVSERTIYRDMEALSGAGVPVAAERGTNGGWVLMDGYETKLTGLNQTEAQALFVQAPARVRGDLGMEQASEAALIRLLASLPTPARRAAEFVRQRIHVDTEGWRAGGEDITHLQLLQEAVMQERRLLIRYERGDRTQSERTVDPLGLVAKGKTWYLVALAEGQTRNYRVSRVREATLLDQSAARPPEFDLAGYWSQSKAEFVTSLPRFEVTVQTTETALHRLRHAWRWTQAEPPSQADEHGRVTVKVAFETDQDACTYLLGAGASVELLEPAYLRERLAQTAAAVLALYRPSRPPDA